MKKSTQIIDLSNVINPRVGDDDLLLPLHIIYGDNQTDMRGKDVEFLSNDPNKKNIYIAGTCNTNTPGDNLYTGDLTFRFPAGTFQADGTYDPDKTMFRIVDKETQKVISSVNVKITVMKNAIEFDFDPDNSSYDSRLETMLHDFHDKGQAMLDEIKDLNNQANSNVSGDTATTANAAKKQADQNAGDISDLKGEVAGARGRFANMAGREDAQDAAINQKESIANANANYAALQQKNAKLEGRQTALSLEYQSKLAQINVNPEFATDINELAAKYPNGKEGVFILNNGHTAIYQNGWQDSGHSITVGSFQFKAFVDVNEVTAPYDSLDTLPANSVVFYAPDVTDRFLASPTIDRKAAIIVITMGADASYTKNYSHIQQVIDRDSGVKYTRSSWIGWDGNGDWFPWHSDNFDKAIMRGTQNLMYGQDISNWTPHVQGVAIISDDPNVQFANTPIMHIESSKADQTSGFVSSPVLVDEKIISVQLPEMIVGQDYPNSHVYISIFPLAEGESVGEQAVNQKAISFPLGNSTMGLSKFENIKLPDGTKKIALGVNQDGIGHLFFGIPAVNYGPKCIAYSPSSIASDLERLDKRIDTNFKLAQMNSQNLLYGQDIRNWSSDVQGEVSLATEADKQFNETPIMHIKGTATGQNNNWISSPIEINNDVISLQLPQMSENEVFGQSNVYLSLLPMAEGENFTDDSVNKKVIAYTLGNSSLSLSKFENIKLPADTKRLVIRFTQQGVGDLYFGIPVLNYGSSCVPYNEVQLGKHIDRSDAVVSQLYISADSSETGYDKTPVSFKLVRKSDIDYGYLNFDIQGDSSRGYPKKNFKIKLFNDPAGKSKLKMRLFPSWQKTNKYNIKANWIDATQSRNVVNAQLIKDAFATTGVDEQSKKLLESEDLGQINGVPIEVYFNGAYYGLCTLNTKKDELTFGMDSKDMTNDVLSTELAAKDFMNSSKKVDGNDWSSEIHDDASDTVKAGLASLQNFVTTSTDVDFKAKLQDYIDVKSVMIEVLYGWLSCEGDYYSKSELLATWNSGKHWCLVPYDLDTTWGLTWNGTNVDINDSWFSFSNTNADNSAITHSGNLLHERVIELFSTELKALAKQLRASVWSNQNIIDKFKTFMDAIPESTYKRDHERWSEIPSLKTTDFKQIQSAVIQRGQEFDDFLNKI